MSLLLTRTQAQHIAQAVAVLNNVNGLLDVTLDGDRRVVIRADGTLHVYEILTAEDVALSLPARSEHYRRQDHFDLVYGVN